MAGEPLASSVTDPFLLDELLATLRRFSLIDLREGSLAMHRLVQVAARERLPAAEQARWALTAERVGPSGTPSLAAIAGLPHPTGRRGSALLSRAAQRRAP